MEMYRRRILIIVAAFAIWCMIALWLVFGLHIARGLGQNRGVYLLLAFLVVLPVVFYFPLAKRKKILTKGTATGLALVSASLVLISLGTVAFAFDLDPVWTDRAFDMSQVLIALSCLVFIGLGIKGARAKSGDK
ncbi:MAG: hypothetical protein ACLQG3_06545 [Terracidiphilus sp.]